MTVAARKRATRRDVADADPSKVAELVDGELFLSPRPESLDAAPFARRPIELARLWVW